LRILGLDFGDRRIGVAISDPARRVALARDTIFVSGREDAIRQLGRIVSDEGVGRVVIGLPLNLDGSVGPRARKTQEFAEALRSRLGVEVDVFDERLTTRIAKRTLHQAGQKATKRDGRLDQISAVFILQGYLDRQRSLQQALPGE